MVNLYLAAAFKPASESTTSWMVLLVCWMACDNN
jgi:hypothetical protein